MIKRADKGSWGNSPSRMGVFMQGVFHRRSTHRQRSCPETPKNGSHDDAAANVKYKCVCVHSHTEMHRNKLLAQFFFPLFQTQNNLQD